MVEKLSSRSKRCLLLPKYFLSLLWCTRAKRNLPLSFTEGIFVFLRRAEKRFNDWLVLSNSWAKGIWSSYTWSFGAVISSNIYLIFTPSSLRDSTLEKSWLRRLFPSMRDDILNTLLVRVGGFILNLARGVTHVR